MIPLLFFLHARTHDAVQIWANREQEARTEAHRDMFDKTTTPILLLPEAPYGTHDAAASPPAQLGTHSGADLSRAVKSMPGPRVSAVGSRRSRSTHRMGSTSPSAGTCIRRASSPTAFPTSTSRAGSTAASGRRGGPAAPRTSSSGRAAGSRARSELKRYGAVIRSPVDLDGLALYVPTQDMYLGAHARFRAGTATTRSTRRGQEATSKLMD